MTIHNKTLLALGLLLTGIWVENTVVPERSEASSRDVDLTETCPAERAGLTNDVHPDKPRQDRICGLAGLGPAP